MVDYKSANATELAVARVKLALFCEKIRSIYSQLCLVASVNSFFTKSLSCLFWKIRLILPIHSTRF